MITNIEAVVLIAVAKCCEWTYGKKSKSVPIECIVRRFNYSSLVDDGIISNKQIKKSLRKLRAYYRYVSIYRGNWKLTKEGFKMAHSLKEPIQERNVIINSPTRYFISACDAPEVVIPF